MALLTVLEYPDKRLRLKASPVTTFDQTLQRFVDDMFETMGHEKGVGLAAIQVNIQQQIIVMDVSENRNSPLCLINPQIIARTGTQYEVEGCLSLPGLYDKVERAHKIEVRAQDVQGKLIELEAEDLLSICIQHEMDHLQGILFLDHLSRLKQERLRKKLQKSRVMQ